MIQKMGVVAATVMLFAACGETQGATESVEATDLSLVELGALLAEHGLVASGRYRVSVQVKNTEVPTLEEDDRQAQLVAQIMRNKLSNVPELITEYCMSPDSAFDPRGQETVECRVPRFSLTGNKAEFTLDCPVPSGRATSSGQYTGTVERDGYVFNSITKVPVTPGPTAAPRDASISTKTTGKRLGDCN